MGQIICPCMLHLANTGSDQCMAAGGQHIAESRHGGEAHVLRPRAESGPHANPTPLRRLMGEEVG